MKNEFLKKTWFEFYQWKWFVNMYECFELLFNRTKEQRFLIWSRSRQGASSSRRRWDFQLIRRLLRRAIDQCWHPSKRFDRPAPWRVRVPHMAIKDWSNSSVFWLAIFKNEDFWLAIFENKAFWFAYRQRTSRIIGGNSKVIFEIGEWYSDCHLSEINDGQIVVSRQRQKWLREIFRDRNTGWSTRKADNLFLIFWRSNVRHVNLFIVMRRHDEWTVHRPVAHVDALKPSIW